MAQEVRAFEAEGIYFDFDKYNLSETARANLVKNAEFLRKDRAEKVRIEGNCDERGSDEYNLALGQRRAEAVKRVMVDHFGLPERQFKTVGYGKESERQVTPGAERNQPRTVSLS